MRITQTLATKAANLLTTKTRVTIEALEAEVDKIALDTYLKTLPKGLASFDKTNPGWIKKDEDLRVEYHSDGKLHTYYAGSEISVPMKNGYAKLSANKSLRAKIIRLEELREKHRMLKKEIYAAVIDLGTSKKVLKVFPETAELFGNTNSTQSTISSSIMDLRIVFYT